MNHQFIEQLKGILSEEQILTDEPMSKHTTFRIGGKADVLVLPKTEQIAAVMRVSHANEVPVTIIGNGSNLLVGDGGIRGLVIELGKEAEQITVTNDTVIAEAGTLLVKVANAAAQAGLSGMEFAAGIPGTIGGAVVMNAGAYGGEMKDIITKVKVLTKDGEVKELALEELDLSYRHSCIPENEYIVLEVELKLLPSKEETIRETMAELREKRVSKQPLEYPSAGSTFKRPVGYFAGKLIDDAGLRGYQVGGAQVSEKHCGFVINKDNATAADVRQLMKDVQTIVYDKFQVNIEPEVKMIGDF